MKIVEEYDEASHRTQFYGNREYYLFKFLKLLYILFD